MSADKDARIAELERKLAEQQVRINQFSKVLDNCYSCGGIAVDIHRAFNEAMLAAPKPEQPK